MALARVSTGNDAGGGGGLTGPVTPRCPSISSRTNLRVSARVVGSTIWRVRRRTVR